MINRALIRLKVVQLVYSFYQNEGKDLLSATEELEFSLHKSYELYHQLLILLIEMRRVAEHREQLRNEKAALVGKKNTDIVSTDAVFAQNKFLMQLEQNEQLAKFAEQNGSIWRENEQMVRALYLNLVENEYFVRYIDTEDFGYDADREIVRKLYKTLIVDNEEIDAILEEQSIYWNDDKETIDSFVLKTIKRFGPETTADYALLPDYATKEDKAFAQDLFRATIQRGDEIRGMLSTSTRNWDFERLAFMDIIIMQTAMAEILNFPTIPVNVTIYEYIGIARVYSAPRSYSYINGMLDNVVRRLRNEDKLMK